MAGWLLLVCLIKQTFYHFFFFVYHVARNVLDINYGLVVELKTHQEQTNERGSSPPARHSLYICIPVPKQYAKNIRRYYLGSICVPTYQSTAVKHQQSIVINNWLFRLTRAETVRERVNKKQTN